MRRMQDDNLRFASSSRPPSSPPPPGAGFRWQLETWGDALVCVPLSSVAQHLFTSKQLGLPAQAAGLAATQAWSAAAASLNTDVQHVLRVKQVHGRTVRVVGRDAMPTAAMTERPEADAIVSNLTGFVLAVVAADCVPIVLVDATRGAAAAVHAGWRGSCAGIAGAAVEAMTREFGTKPADVFAALGPSIGPDDYVVGESVKGEFAMAGHDDVSLARWFRPAPAAGSVFLDLWQANQDQLRRAGVPDTHIFNAGLSTFAHPDWLESFRRDGAAAGRLVALVKVPGGRA